MHFENMEERSSTPRPDLIEAQIKRLINQHLKNVCKRLGLAVSGPKAVLQSRIIDYLHLAVRRGKIDILEKIRKTVASPDAAPRISSDSIPTVLAEGPGSSQSTATKGLSKLHNDSCRPEEAALTFELFKSSPFYTMLQALCAPFECKVRESSRETITMTARLDKAASHSLKTDANSRALLVCGTTSDYSLRRRIEVSFPQHVEIKINNIELKANLKGLKNKPGTAVPPDITDLLFKDVSSENKITVTYALTLRKYLMMLYLVRFHPPSELVRDIGLRHRKPAHEVMHEIANNKANSEVMTTSSIMSLKCPLSTLRMAHPSRSWQCAHTQCFDAVCFLELQLQAPTWVCPICNKLINLDAIFIDEYVESILQSTGPEVNQVVIESSGAWSLYEAEKDSSVAVQDYRPCGAAATYDGIHEIDESAIHSNLIDKNAGARSNDLASTQYSRPTSTVRTSNETAAPSVVVDLTTSSDDEEEEAFRTIRKESSHLF